MKRIFVVAFCLFFTCDVYCQDVKLDGIFAFVFSGGTLPSNEASIKNIDIQTVFDNLVEAKGVKSILPPKLVISNSESVAAWAHPETQTIGIELKAIDICRSFGRDSLDAIAALLSHELIHYYEKHDWSNHFIRNYSSIVEEHAFDPKAGKQMEMEADDLGGLLAQMAGYKSLSVMSELLSRIYKGYNLDESASTFYPDLDTRKAMANISKENLELLIPLFEAANYLTITGREIIAARYLEYIVSKSGFVSREIYNNLGVLYAVAASEAQTQNSISFQFPFHIDFESRLGIRGFIELSFDELTKKSSHYLENAILLDREYVPAYINLASLNIMSDREEDAEFQIFKIKKLGVEQKQIDLLNGLLQLYKGNMAQATELLEKSAEAGNLTAKTNLRLLAGNKIVSTHVQKQMPNIDHVDLDKLYARIMSEEVSPSSSIDLDESCSFYTVMMENSEVYIHMDYESDERFSFFHVIDQNDDLLPVKIGETKEILLAHFGEPDVVFGGYGQEIYNYKNHNLIAVIKNGLVYKWCIYKQNLN